MIYYAYLELRRAFFFALEDTKMHANMTSTTKRLLTPTEAAEFLGIKPQTLAVWRSSKRYDLPYVRCGNAIRYKLSDLEKWLESRTVGSVVEK